MKKMLSLLLVLSMLFSMVPIAVFAAEAPTISVSSATVETGGTVVVEVSISNNTGFTNFDLKVNHDENLTLTKISQGDLLKTYNDENEDLVWTQYVGTGKFSAVAPSAAISGDGVIAKLTFTAGEVSATSNVSISMNETATAAMKNGDVEIAPEFPVSTITVGSTTPPATGYTANMTTSANNNEVVSGSDIKVNVAVSHSADTVFNAGEIKLTYDGTKLIPNATELDKLVNDGTLSGYKVGSNVLTIEGFGGDKTMPCTYSIPFTAADDVDVETTDTVTLTRAAFIHKDNASSSDLIEATKTPESLTVTIKVAMVDVTLTNHNDTNDTTTVQTQKGQDYTFAPTDTANYTYSNVTATVGEQSVDVIDNKDGTFTIEGKDVTGNISLTYTKTAKSYGVTINTVFGENTTSENSTATYNAAYEFTVPDDVPAGTDVGYTYALTSVTIGDENYTGYQVAEGTRSYTIPGADITGEIVITITKTEQPADTFTVTKDGTGAGDATVNNTDGYVKSGDTASITVTAETGYSYTVTAKMGNADAQVVTDGNTYKVEKVTANVVFTVTKTLNVSSVAVKEYVKVDNYVIWLVTFDGTLAEGKIPTYDGSNMFWSDSYDAYCYLVKETTLDAETAGTKIGAATATATPVDYGMDINGTNVIDAADAQMVWNMYNAEYAEFNTGAEDDKNPTMAQFLAADQNATSENTTWGLNVQDALVIITAILENNATI